MRTIELEARAKINIGLNVMGKRADGYHDLETHFHVISLSDSIRLSLGESVETAVSIKGNESYLPEGATDLMEKAARLYSSLSGKTFKLEIEIQKRIPHQAGLGGGSSDAATVLLGLDKLFGNIVGRERLLESSLTLGSDVPFFVSGFSAALGKGRGEILEEIEPVSCPCLVVMRPGDRVSTAGAFAALDKRGEDGILPLAPWTPDTSLWASLYHNDFSFLQPVLSDPVFREVSSRALWSSTTGSGAAQVLLFDSPAAMDRAGEKLLSSSFKVWRARLGG